MEFSLESALESEVHMSYLVCKKCGNYYEIQDGESPSEFESCQCGGSLRYVESLDDLDGDGFEEIESYESADGSIGGSIGGSVGGSDDGLVLDSFEESIGDSENVEVFEESESHKKKYELRKRRYSTYLFGASAILGLILVLVVLNGIFANSGNSFYSNENDKYSREDVDCFLETVFNNDAYGRKQEKIGKWGINTVRIRVFGNPTKEDLKTLNKAINDINSNVDGFKMVIDNGNAFEPDMEVYFITHSEFSRYFSVPNNYDGWASWKVSATGAYGGNPAGEIFKARVFIATDGLSQKRRSSVIVHEMGHSLGFNHNTNMNSVLCEYGSDKTEFSPIDKTMIRMLYRSDIQPYMDKNQVETMLNNSIKESFF